MDSLNRSLHTFIRFAMAAGQATPVARTRQPHLAGRRRCETLRIVAGEAVSFYCGLPANLTQLQPARREQGVAKPLQPVSRGVDGAQHNA